MTVRIAICVVALVTCTAWAQDSPQGTINSMRRQIKNIGNATEQRRQSAASQLGLSTGVDRASSAQPAPLTHSTPSTRAANSPRASAQKSVTKSKRAKPVSKKRVAAPAEASAAPEMKPTKRVITMQGKRDPFETIIRSETIGTCGSGKKCLVVGSIELKGIVSAPNGMIAVVENQQRRTYFLHESDPVFNGQVIKIGPDSIVFRETVTDKAGRRSEKEVVKRLPASPSV